jgi:hypothetical protein
MIRPFVLARLPPANLKPSHLDSGASLSVVRGEETLARLLVEWYWGTPVAATVCGTGFSYLRLNAEQLSAQSTTSSIPFVDEADGSRSLEVALSLLSLDASGGSCVICTASEMEQG